MRRLAAILCAATMGCQEPQVEEKELSLSLEYVAGPVPEPPKKIIGVTALTFSKIDHYFEPFKVYAQVQYPIDGAEVPLSRQEELFRGKELLLFRNEKEELYCYTMDFLLI